MENHIKKYRAEKGLTQDELARAVEVSRQTIISLESGKYVASLPLAFKLARFFDVQIEDLFVEEDV